MSGRICGGQVHHDGALGLEGRGDRDAVEARVLQRPTDHVGGVRQLELGVADRQFLRRQQCLHSGPPSVQVARVYTGP